ncbi:hypothetical protein O5699_00585 [Escherichia coli]|nr:hypothetical protein [Escherichia coli]
MTDIKRSEFIFMTITVGLLCQEMITKTAADRHRFSRKEGYEVLNMLNSFKAYSLKKLIVEMDDSRTLTIRYSGKGKC